MQSGPPPNILSVPPPLRYITFGTSWSSANALQISHFHTAYVQSRSANKHCNTACVQSRSANKHCNTAYMQSRSANKHCNTAYMQSRSANSHGHYIIGLMGGNNFVCGICRGRDFCSCPLLVTGLYVVHIGNEIRYSLCPPIHNETTSAERERGGEKR